MNIELNIIKHLLNKETYNKYISYINVSKELQKHYKLLEELHTSTNNNLTLDEYVLHAEQQGCDYLDVLKESNVSDESLEKLIKTLSERSWAHTQALLLVEVSEGRRELSDALQHYSKIEDIVASNVEEKSEFVTDDFEVISQITDKDGGLKWRLPSLQEQLGGQKQGHFGFVFARNNTGKTTFLTSEVAHMSTQTEKPIIWFNNEQEKHVVQARLMQSALGWTDEQMRIDSKRTSEAFRRLTKDRIKLYDSSFMHKDVVKNIVSKYSPALIVIDSIDALKGFKAERKDILFGDIYNWCRMLAKDHCAVIGICQASISAENKKWLQDSDIEEAKTSKSTEADWIIGIGKTYDVGMEDVRHIHIIKDKYNCKIKKINCRILPEIGRYEEL